MMVHKRNKYCNGRFSNASEICPQTCLGQCPCKDDKSTEFIDKKQRKKSCLWLSWMKQFSNKRKYCKRNRSAMKGCPYTCEGWCIGKGFPSPARPQTTKPSTEPSTIPTPSPSTSQTTTAPTAFEPQSSKPSFQGKGIVDALLNVSDSALFDISTPQYKAVQWLIHDDRDGRDKEDPRLVQRYILALLYFALNGEEWVNQDGFVTDEDECFWFGISYTWDY